MYIYIYMHIVGQQQEKSQHGLHHRNLHHWIFGTRSKNTIQAVWDSWFPPLMVMKQKTCVAGWIFTMFDLATWKGNMKWNRAERLRNWLKQETPSKWCKTRDPHKSSGLVLFPFGPPFSVPDELMEYQNCNELIIWYFLINYLISWLVSAIIRVNCVSE